MKKFFITLVCLGLAASLIALMSVSGERTALREEAKKEAQKYDALKTMYDREKGEWRAASEKLNADKAALTLEKQALAAALAEMRPEAETVSAEPEPPETEQDEANAQPSKIPADAASETESLLPAGKTLPKALVQPKRPEPLPY